MYGYGFIWYGSGSSILGLIPIRIQSGSRGFDDQKLKKIYSWKKKKFVFVYLSLGLHKGRPSYKRSLHLSKENIQHFITWNFLIFFYFSGLFLSSWIRIRIPNTDPDPLTRLNPDPIRVRFRIRICNPAKTVYGYAFILVGWIWIRNRIGCTDPDPDLWGPKGPTKEKKIQVLKCSLLRNEDSCSLDVLNGIIKLQFLIKKI